MENSVEYDLERTCRSCLVHSNDLKSLFNNSTSEENTDSSTTRRALVEIIMECTQVKILKDDGMPYKICTNCTTQVQNAYAYKIKCEESDMKLRKYLAGKCLGVKIKIEDEEYSDFKMENPTDEDPLVGELGKVAKSSKGNSSEYSDFELNNEDCGDGGDGRDDGDGGDGGDNGSDNDSNGVPNKTKSSRRKSTKNSRRTKCNVCSKSFADKRTLKIHSRLHTGKGLKRCKTCGKGFAKKNHLDRHMVTHLKKEYSCDHCPEKFETYQERRLHLVVHNSPVKKRKGRKPKIIKEEESSVGQQSMHLLYILGRSNGIKQCTCKICNQTFSRIYLLRKHLLWHMEDVDSFHNINLKMKTELFAHDVGGESEETLQVLIQNQLKSNNSERFYQILNDNAWEMTLSDSETESENEFINSDWKPPKKPNYTCSKCDKLFDRKYKTINHMRNDHNEHEFGDKCTLCECQFPNTEILARHLKGHCENQAKQICCQLCKVKFMWQSSLDAHNEKIHINKDFIIRELAKDLTNKYNKPKEKTFVCDICPKAFFRSEHLDRHRKVHMPAEKKFTCDICKKKFNRKDNLKSHMRVHKQEKETTDKHLCVYCGRSFSNSSNLIVHMRRHTGEKPYKCDFCDKGFPRSSDLQCHRRTHTGEKPCLCTICGKGFSRSNKLVRHMRIHTGVRPYKCPYCERAFTQSNDLTLHIRRHTGDKPYVCGVCGDRFIQGTALQTHRRVQGHFEDNQPTPFASISAQNPSRYTNANRVNRIGIVPLESIVKQELKPILPIPLSMPTKREIPTPTNISEQNPAIIPPPPLPPTHPNHNTSNSALRMPTFPIPPSPYVPNGNPFLMQNLEMPSMFSIPPFGQNYN